MDVFLATNQKHRSFEKFIIKNFAHPFESFSVKRFTVFIEVVASDLTVKKISCCHA